MLACLQFANLASCVDESDVPTQGLLRFKCAIQIATSAGTASGLPALDVKAGAQDTAGSLLRVDGSGAQNGASLVSFVNVPSGGSTGVPAG